MTAAASFVAVLLLLQGVAAYVYQLPSQKLKVGVATAYQDGPMYGNDGWQGASQTEAYMDFHGQAQAASPVVFNVAFADYFFADMLFCCDAEQSAQGNCQGAVGSLVVRRPDASAREPVVFSFALPANESVELSGKMSVPHTSSNAMTRSSTGHAVHHMPHAFLAACPTSQAAAAEQVTVSGRFRFHGPNGFLPGVRVGLMPFYLVMFFAYASPLLAYCLLAVRHRDTLHYLQFCLLAVILLGAVEYGNQYLLYVQMNSSGDRPCCPILPLAGSAIVFTVMKRTISRTVLLLLALGFGVTRDRLERKTSIAVAALSVLYFAFSVNLEMVEDSQASSSANTLNSTALLLSAVPVYLLDITFMTTIYANLVGIRTALKQTRQTLKASMYRSLVRVLSVFFVLWGVWAIAYVTISLGGITVPWQNFWLVASFWDILFLFVLLAVCYIWRPNANSAALAYSNQLPLSDEDAEADDGERPDDFAIEMAGMASVGVTFSAAGDDEDEEESDGEHAGDEHADDFSAYGGRLEIEEEDGEDEEDEEEDGADKDEEEGKGDD